MNKKLISVVFLAILVSVSVLIVGCTNNLPQQAQSQQQKYVLNVDDILVDPSAYTGKIVVQGAVSFANPEKKSFEIIDLKEFDQCGVVTCAINHLTVNYPNPLPNVKDRVEITGELIRTNQGYVLNAETVKLK